MSATLADTLRQFGPAYVADHLADHLLSTAQAKALRANVACRTPVLAIPLAAPPLVPAMRRARQRRLSEVLPVPYANLVFTLPHGLNGLYGAHPRWVIDNLVCLHGANSWPVCRQWMGSAHGTPAFSLVLHIWTQDLATHLHLHAMMACGVLAKAFNFIGAV